MATKTVVVNLRNIREALGAEIDTLQTAMTASRRAMQRSADSVNMKQLSDNTSQARNLLVKLLEQEAALSNACCDTKTQNCMFELEDGE